MARVKQVKARQDYPAQGISKGDLHWTWSTRTTVGNRYISHTHRSMTKPKPSQTTTSEFKAQAFALNGQLEEWEGSPGDAESFRDDLKGEAESLRDETQDKLDNMPEGLQASPTGELLQERIDALEAFISELEGVDFPGEELGEEPEDLEDGEDDDDFNERHDEWSNLHDAWEEAVEALKAVTLDVM